MVPPLIRLTVPSVVPLPTARVAPVLSIRPASAMAPEPMIVPILSVVTEPFSTSEVAFAIVPLLLFQELRTPLLS